MNQTTWNLKVDTLIEEINNHPHRDELLTLINEQVADDLLVRIGINTDC
jgi:hypothetical protein